jgi:opacity protein-like surface antigen
MKTWVQALTGVALVVQAGVAGAGESAWSLRLGASYRDFDDMSFEASGLRNWERSNSAGPYGVQNITTAPGNPILAPVILDSVRWDGGSSSIDSSDKWSPVLGFRYDLTRPCWARLALVGNAQYYRLGTDAGASGSAVSPNGFDVQQHQYFVTDTQGTLTPGAVLVGGPMPGTGFSARNQFDMDLYVLDIGLEARATVSRVNFSLAVGPTLTIADAESSQMEQATWASQGPGLAAGGYSQDRSDSATDALLGVYGALGVSVDITPSWAIGLEYRYDYVGDDAGTDQAEMDLSGSSGILSVTYRF